MISPEVRAQMRRLVLVERMKIETVARRFGVHHTTVRRALDDGLTDEPSGRPSVLEPFKPYIVDRLTEHPELTSTRLAAELRERGYVNGVAQLRRFVAKVRAPRMRKAYLRVEVEPGEQAQVDWGSFGSLRIGRTQRPLSAFAMVLSWSRALYVDFSLDMKMETFCAMHRRALEFFGGVPRRILYDNLKSVVLHHAGATVQFNPRFTDFAGHYLFEPVAAPVRYPEAKGKVESAIKYIRHSFFYGRSFSSLEDLRAQLAAWLEHTANARLHATTRERPAERLLIERTRLRALPAHAYDTDLVETAVVSKECSVHLDSNAYSVMPELVGKTVQVRASATDVRILLDGQLVTEHPRCWERRRRIEKPEHLAKLLERRPGAQLSRSRDRIASLCPEAPLYLKEVARTRRSLKTEIEKLTRLLVRYGPEDVARGIVAAIAQRRFGAAVVHALIDQSRFARGQSEPAEPVLTGNKLADTLVVESHPMESYDELFGNDDAADGADD
jgi:transposase